MTLFFILLGSAFALISGAMCIYIIKQTPYEDDPDNDDPHHYI